MLEQLMYAISLKAQAECPQCKEGQQLDQSHGCYFVSSSYHERWQLLCHFNASVDTVWQILKTPTMLDNVKEYINTRLLQAGFSTDDIANVNTHYGMSLIKTKLSFGYLSNCGITARTKFLTFNQHGWILQHLLHLHHHLQVNGQLIQVDMK